MGKKIGCTFIHAISYLVGSESDETPASHGPRPFQKFFLPLDHDDTSSEATFAIAEPAKKLHSPACNALGNKLATYASTKRS
jgi:hypothetical protein